MKKMILEGNVSLDFLMEETLDEILGCEIRGNFEGGKIFTMKHDPFPQIKKYTIISLMSIADPITIDLS